MGRRSRCIGEAFPLFFSKMNEEVIVFERWGLGLLYTDYMMFCAFSYRFFSRAHWVVVVLPFVRLLENVVGGKALDRLLSSPHLLFCQESIHDLKATQLSYSFKPPSPNIHKQQAQRLPLPPHPLAPRVPLPALHAENLPPLQRAARPGILQAPAPARQGPDCDDFFCCDGGGGWGGWGGGVGGEWGCGGVFG